MADRVVEVSVRLCRVEGQRGGTSIAQEIESGCRLRRSGWITGAKNDGRALRDLHPYGLAVARHGDAKISPTAGGHRHGPIRHLGRAIDRVAVDGEYSERRIGPGFDRPVVGIDHPDSHLLTRLGGHRQITRRAVDRLHAGIGVSCWRPRQRRSSRLAFGRTTKVPKSPPITCSLDT